MSEDLNPKNKVQKSVIQSEEPGKEDKRNCLVNKLIFTVCCSIIAFTGLNFISCNFMIPGSMNRANLLGGLKNPPPLDCKESEKRGYDALLAVLTTVIALKTKMD